MNEIIKRNTTEVASSNANPFLEHADSATQRNIVGKLLSFSKGDWYAGQDKDEVPEGTMFIANMGEMLKGWQRWEDNKPTDQIMGKVMDRFQPPRRSELPDQDRSEWEVDAAGKERDPWQMTNYLLMKGHNDGQLYTFTTSSKGGLDAMALLCRAYGPNMATRPDHWPIVEIGDDSYPHPKKELGRIKYPTFKIVGWALKSVFDADLGEQSAVEDDGALQEEFPEPEPARMAPPAPRPAPKKNRI